MPKDKYVCDTGRQASPDGTQKGDINRDKERKK